MSETVCVTVEQLREIEWADGTYEHRGVFSCPACASEREHGHVKMCWLGNAIARAERLKEWRPNVGDLVRLRAMPMAGTYKVIETLGRMCRIGVTSESKVTFGIDGQWRERAELMPEE